MFKEFPEKPHGDPKTIIQSFGEKYLPTTFHHFRAKYFPSFRNFAPRILDTVTTEFDETEYNLINIP